MEKPFDSLLHRELHIHDVQQHYANQLALMRDVVNYGTNLIPSCIISSNRSLGDVVVLAVLLKQLVSMLDGLEVLVSKACVPAALLQARAIFEASVQLDFLLKDDKDKKAEFFYVANVRKDLLWAKRTHEGAPEAEKFREALGRFADVLEPTREKLAEASEDRIAVVEDFFQKDPWRAINDRFDELRGNKPFDVNWYAEFGCSSFRKLSEAVGRLHEYEIFYSMSSEKMHGSDYKSHISFAEGHVTLTPVRNLSSAAAVINFSLSSALHSYQAILNAYRPGQLQEFFRRYVRDWREPFLSIKSITYITGEGGPATI